MHSGWCVADGDTAPVALCVTRGFALAGLVLRGGGLSR